jgi:GT2 family glycosyltransferase
MVRARFSEFELLTNECNLGFAGAANQALHLASEREFDFLAFINPDATADPNWLAELVSAARNTEERCASFACWMKQADREDVVDGLGDSYHISGLAWRRRHGRRCRQGWLIADEVFGACGGAAFYRVSALIEVGGFEDALFCYFEDVDLAFRLRSRGYVASLVPTATVSHIGSATSSLRGPIPTYYGVRNMSWVYIRNMPLGLLIVTLPLHLLAQIAMFGLAAARGQALAAARAQWDAVREIPAKLRERRSIQAQREVGALALLRVMRKIPVGRP